MIFVDGKAMDGVVRCGDTEIRGAHCDKTPVYAKLVVVLRARRTNGWGVYNYNFEVSRYEAPFLFKSRVDCNVDGFWGLILKDSYYVNEYNYYNFTHESGGTDTLSMSISGETMPYYNGGLSYTGTWHYPEEGWGRAVIKTVLC